MRCVRETRTFLCDRSHVLGDGGQQDTFITQTCTHSLAHSDSHTQAHMQTHTCTHVHTCSQTHMHAHTGTHSFMHTCMHTGTHRYTRHTCMLAHMHTRAETRAHGHTCTHMHMREHVHTVAHTHTHAMLFKQCSAGFETERATLPAHFLSHACSFTPHFSQKLVIIGKTPSVIPS